MKKALGFLALGSVLVSALVLAAAQPVRPVASLSEILPAERRGVTTVETVDAPVLVSEVVVVAPKPVTKTARKATTFAKRDWHTMEQGPVSRLVRDL